MTDPELDLTPEELALLAEHDDVEVAPVAPLGHIVVVDEPPAQDLELDGKPKRRGRKPAARPEPDLTPAPMPTFEPEQVLDPEPAIDVDAALAKAHASVAAVDDLVDQRTEEALADLSRYLPGPEHPHAPPAQMHYDDPWGQLPAQMRHDMHGRPCP